MSKLKKELTSEDLVAYTKEVLKSKESVRKFFVDAGINNPDGSLTDMYKEDTEIENREIGFKQSKS